MYGLSLKSQQSRHTRFRFLRTEVCVRPGVLFLVLDHLPTLEKLRIEGIVREQLDSLVNVGDEQPSSSPREFYLE